MKPRILHLIRDMKKQHKILIDSLAYEVKAITRKNDQIFKQLE